jgi:C-terminal processing protease CtpA/Prc
VLPLTGGRAVKLTTSRYYTPSGRSIQGSGIEPDVKLDGIDAQPLDLEDARVRQTLAAQDAGVRAGLDALRGRKPRPASGMTASTASGHRN